MPKCYRTLTQVNQKSIDETAFVAADVRPGDGAAVAVEIEAREDTVSVAGHGANARVDGDAARTRRAVVAAFAVNEGERTLRGRRQERPVAECRARHVVRKVRKVAAVIGVCPECR